MTRKLALYLGMGLLASTAMFAQTTTSNTSTITQSLPPFGLGSTETARLDLTNFASNTTGGTAASCTGHRFLLQRGRHNHWDGNYLHRDSRADRFGEFGIHQRWFLGQPRRASRSDYLDPDFRCALRIADFVPDVRYVQRRDSYLSRGCF